MNLTEFVRLALDEDVRDGDHSTLACIPAEERGRALLKIKEDGIIAGIDVAEQIFRTVEPDCILTLHKKDGDTVKAGDTAFLLEASVQTILKTERLVLNIMQRMSGIASLTRQYADKIKQYPGTILDTRKTTPLFRWFEKRAVVLGGGQNHRMGLYDMIMLKDNHIDYCGSLEKAIDKTLLYLKEKNLNLRIEVEARSVEDVQRIVQHGGIHRIMFDNFSPGQISESLKWVDGRFETEASGGIELDTIEAYAATGVQYISVGAIIHHANSMDLSLKAVK